MLIAVTSSDGVTIDLHFGKAEAFMLFEVGDGEALLVREVSVPSYCGGVAEGHSLMPEKLAAIAQALTGCRIIVTAMIGAAPQAEMERLGFDVVTVSGPIVATLSEVAKIY